MVSLTHFVKLIKVTVITYWGYCVKGATSHNYLGICRRCSISHLSSCKRDATSYLCSYRRGTITNRCCCRRGAIYLSDVAVEGVLYPIDVLVKSACGGLDSLFYAMMYWYIVNWKLYMKMMNNNVFKSFSLLTNFSLILVSCYT